MRQLRAIIISFIIRISPIRFLIGSIIEFEWKMAIHYDKNKKVTGIICGDEAYVNRAVVRYQCAENSDDEKWKILI